MKLILIAIIAFLTFAAPAFSELAVKDLEKIRAIVKASEDRLKGDLKASEDRLKGDLKASEDRLKEDVENIRSTIKESEDRLMKHIDDKVSEIDKRLNIIFGFVIALISLIVIVIGVPQIIMAWRGKEDRTQKEQIQELRQEIETLKQYIVTTDMDATSDSGSRG